MAEDVQNSIATVVVEDSPDVLARSLAAVGAVVSRVPLDTTFTADSVVQVLRFLVIQHFPLLIYSLPTFKNPVNR